MKKGLFKVMILIIAVIASAVMLNGQVNTERFRKDGQTEGFHFKWGLAMAMYKGNIDLFRVDSSVDISYVKKKNYLFLIGNLNYGEKNGSSYIDKGFAHLRGIHRLSDRFMVEAFAQQEFNRFILLNSRTLAGAGLRFLALKNAGKNSGFAVHVGLGLMWEKEKFDERDGEVVKEDSSLFKSTNYISLNWQLNEKTKLDNVTYIQFSIGDKNSTRVTSELVFNVKLSKVLGYVAKVNYRHDSNPPDSVKKDDVQLTNGITLSF